MSLMTYNRPCQEQTEWCCHGGSRPAPKLLQDALASPGKAAPHPRLGCSDNGFECLGYGFTRNNLMVADDTLERLPA
jgi:hypothetical protein